MYENRRSSRIRTRSDKEKVKEMVKEKQRVLEEYMKHSTSHMPTQQSTDPNKMLMKIIINDLMWLLIGEQKVHILDAATTEHHRPCLAQALKLFLFFYTYTVLVPISFSISLHFLVSDVMR